MNQDKLTLALARGLEAGRLLAWREERLQAARLLGISKTAVLKRLEAGRLLAARFPHWQFDDRGRVLVGLEEVLAILNQDERLDAWGQILFFLQEKGSFGSRRPLDLLRHGRLKAVCLAAGAYVE